YAVGYFLRQGRREFLDFVTHAAAGAVGHYPDFRFARTHESGDALRPNRNVTSVRHQGVQRNVKAWWQLYFTQILLNLIRLLTGLRDFGPISSAARLMHCTQSFEYGGRIWRGRRWLRSSRPGGQRQ